VDYRSKRTQE